MDFELSDDQVALRDGIRSVCEGRFPIKRVRAGFDRAACAELADAGVFDSACVLRWISYRAVAGQSASIEIGVGLRPSYL